MSRGKSSHRPESKKAAAATLPVSPAPAAPAPMLVPMPPLHRRPWLLAASIAALGGWTAFLAWMAWTASRG